MKSTFAVLFLGALLLAPASAGGEEAQLTFGGDQYAAGQNVAVSGPVARDAFLAGSDVTLSGPVTGDAHLAGFDVNVAAPVAGDVYAMGYSVDVTAAVGGDVTAAAESVTLRDATPVGGNIRLAGRSVTLATPITGSALISADTLTLDAPVSGDLNFYGRTIVFSPGARVDGQFSIQAPNEIAVPATVADASRVQFTQFTSPDYVSETGRTAAETVAKRFWPALWMTALGLLALLVLGAALIAFIPGTIEKLRVVSEKRPFRNIAVGVLAFAALIGLVPTVALTIVGLLAVPFVIVFVGVFFLLGYLSGAYFVGLRIAVAFARIDSNAKRIAVLAVSLVVAALLGLIPVVGWLLVLTLTVFGLGVVAVLLMVRWSAKDAARLEAAGAAPVAAP